MLPEYEITHNLDSLMQMELHASIDQGYLTIIRVPNGWIYQVRNQTTERHITKMTETEKELITSVFVPEHLSNR